MSVDEYWIGKGIDLRRVWDDYEQGAGYIYKYSTMSPHLIQFTFSNPEAKSPLFNYEAVLKTMKAYFHESKYLSLSQNDYNNAGPLFLYEINRGSAIWSFLGGVRQLILFGTTLADEQLKNLLLDNQLKDLSILDKKIEILKKYFGDSAEMKDFRQFMSAKKPEDLRKAVNRMMLEGIEKVEISTVPFKGNIQEVKASLVDIKKELGSIFS